MHFPYKSMKYKRSILLVLGTPPPFGGGEIRAGIVKEHFRNNPNFRIFGYSRATGNKSTQGRATAGNLIFGFYYISQCISLMLWLRPRKIFLSIPKNFGAFLRMIPVILFASLMRIKVCGELAGARFLFLEEGWKKTVGLFVLRRMHSIRFLGEQIKTAHAQYGLSNPIVFSNGIRISEDRQHYQEQEKEPVRLLAVGALNRSKGTGRIIEAVALCREKGLDVCCTLVGEWSDLQLKEEMAQFIREKYLSEQICFTGLIKGEEKWEYFRKATILVHPTDWDGQPLTILEAIGMGLAIISTPVGAIPDTVTNGKNGVLLPENTPEKLADAISELYMNRERLRQIMEYNQADFDCRFTVETYLKNLRNWLETV